MTFLIVTEKPNAAKKIAEALAEKRPEKKNISGVSYYTFKRKNQEIIVSCAVGHLYTVTEKKKSFTYPSFDLVWKPTGDVDKNSAYTKKYLNVIKSLSKKAKDFIIACDYDTEGEVIGLNIVRFACNQKDAQRMKFSTLTKPDLIKSFDNRMKSLDWGQAIAGETRHFLDWMYGINLSRALTLSLKKAGIFKIMSSGRVQGPALKLIVDKEKEIKSFKSQNYWEIQLNGILNNKNIEAWHKNGKFWDEKEAQRIFSKTRGKDGKVENIDKKEQQIRPVHPFDLTTLQIEAYRCLSITPKITLNIAQNLYLKGLISYPRTSSQKLPKEINYKKIISDLSKNSDFKSLINILPKELIPFEGTKTDPAHPAIYPTGINAKLEGQEKRLYDLIVKRFLACFSEYAIRELINITINVENELFIASGARTIKKGWQAIYESYLKFGEQLLPEAKVGDKVSVKEILKLDKQTQPPKRFSEASIIKELEKRNLGTKATRAAIIDALYQRNYVTGKTIEATRMGIQTVETLEKYCPEILDEELTREIEIEMENIRENKGAEEKVIETAKKELTLVLDHFKKNEKKIGEELKTQFIISREEENTLGGCPKCGSKIKIMYSKKIKKKFAACENENCKTFFNLPQGVLIKPTDQKCDHCGFPVVKIIKKKSVQQVCINPECASKISNDKTIVKEIQDMKSGDIQKICPKCNNKLVLRQSIYGSFYGCSSFPKCRYTERIANGQNKNQVENRKTNKIIISSNKNSDKKIVDTPQNNINAKKSKSSKKIKL